MVSLKIKKVHKDAVIPKYMTDGAAGFDLTAVTLKINKEQHTFEYGLGLAFEIPKGYYLDVRPRSSIKNVDLMLTNSCGVIDSDYRGEVSAVFKCNAEMKIMSNVEPVIYNVGDRVVQAILKKHEMADIIEVEELSKTERGEGGYGSTGK
jgi:dUTP pyrophosphatase